MGEIQQELAAQIANELTEQQRAAFLRSADADMHPSNAGRISTYGDEAVGRELYALGLTQRPSTFSLATSLGLAVRKVVEIRALDAPNPASNLQTKTGEGND